MLLIRSMTEWVATWKQNNWKKNENKYVKDIDTGVKNVDILK